MNKIIVGGLAAAALAAGVALAAPAQADFHQDVQFMALLDSHHIEVVDNNTSWAHGVCNGLDQGYTPQQETEAVYRASPLNHDDSMWFVAASMVVYCPWHQGQSFYASQPLNRAPIPGTVV